MENYEFDGIWENSVGFGAGPCYCMRCRERYREETGEEIPETADYEDPVFSKYRRWKAKCADEHLARMRAAVKKWGEEKAYCAEIFGMFHRNSAFLTGIDLYNAGKHFDFLVTPAFLDGGADAERKWEDPLSAASAVKFLKAIEPEKQAVVLCGNNGTKWRYVKAPSLESKIWMWEIAAEGGGIWNCYFNGQNPDKAEDRRNAYLEREVYAYLGRREEAVGRREETLTGQVSAADVGIFYSKPSRDLFGRDRETEDEYGVYIKGAEQVLVENHIPYRFVPDIHFSYENIRSLKVLILANTLCMSDEQIAVVRRYVQNGGGLVATYKTSLYDTDGTVRKDFGLKDLFGCGSLGIVKDTAADSYQMIRNRHPVLEGMDSEKTRFLMNEGRTLLCRTVPGTHMTMVTSFVEPIYNQPPENAWTSQAETEHPVCMVGTYGAGRVVYFSNETDRLCRTNGHEDFCLSYINGIRWAGGRPFLIKTDAPGSVHVHVTQTRPGDYVISFVNTTAGTSRPARSLVPAGQITLLLSKEAGELKAWRVLSSEQAEVSLKSPEEEYGICIHIENLKEFASVFICTKV